MFSEDIQLIQPNIGPKACKLGKCPTLRQRNRLAHNSMDEMLTFLQNIDVEALISAFQFLKEGNQFVYRFIMDTPHEFLENVGIRRAVLIVKAMKKHVMPFLRNIDLQQNDDQYSENNFATYCYTAAKAFGTYNSNMQTDVEIVANYIRATVDWKLKKYYKTTKYPETAGSILNANEGAKCYGLLTDGQVRTLLRRINGQALHKCTMLSGELVDSLKESDYCDESLRDAPFYGSENFLRILRHQKSGTKYPSTKKSY